MHPTTCFLGLFLSQTIQNYGEIQYREPGGRHSCVTRVGPHTIQHERNLAQKGSSQFEQQRKAGLGLSPVLSTTVSRLVRICWLVCLPLMERKRIVAYRSGDGDRGGAWRGYLSWSVSTRRLLGWRSDSVEGHGDTSGLVPKRECLVVCLCFVCDGDSVTRM